VIPLGDDTYNSQLDVIYIIMKLREMFFHFLRILKSIYLGDQPQSGILISTLVRDSV
jgi:hypothetical protein